MTLRVLVVDDSPTVRKLVEIAFRSTDWVHAFAATGAEGVAQARRFRPDVVLLDFVLPDQRGVDVCAQLARDERTSRIPIVLMTAKEADVKVLFRPYPAVVGYVRKPFAAGAILDAIRRAAEGGARVAEPRASSNARPSRANERHARKQAAAKAIYARLRASFAAIPALVEEAAGAGPIAPFLARKILTPEVVDDLLDALEPLAHGDGRESTSSSGATLAGRLAGWPARDLLTLCAGSGRTGELTLRRGDVVTVAYLRGGEIVLVTTPDPARARRHCDVDVAHVPRGILERAEAEQRATSRPVLVTLAEAGQLPTCDLTAVLHDQSRRLLREALASNDVEFAFRDLGVLPLYVEAHGRHVPLARETLIFGPPSEPTAISSLAQVTLERLRIEPAPPALLPRPIAVFNRTRGFSERVRQFSLSAEERTLLALVDGRTTLEELATRSGVDLDVAQIAHRLVAVGLLSECEVRSEASVGSGASARRPVMILEPDVEGFQRPLEILLSGRPDPLPLVSLGPERDVVAAVRSARPKLVILNAEAAGVGIGATARAIREERELADVGLVAVLEAPVASRVQELSQAGFDAVLVKPIAYADLERLLGT